MLLIVIYVKVLDKAELTPRYPLPYRPISKSPTVGKSRNDITDEEDVPAKRWPTFEYEFRLQSSNFTRDGVRVKWVPKEKAPEIAGPSIGTFAGREDKTGEQQYYDIRKSPLWNIGESRRDSGRKKKEKRMDDSDDESDDEESQNV